MAFGDDQDPRIGKAFSSDYQPSGEAKSEGRKKAFAKKRALKELADIAIGGAALEDAQSIAESVGLDFGDDEISLEIYMTLKQISKAITDGDTRAYDSAMNRLKGRVSVDIDQTISIEKMSDSQVEKVFEKLMHNINANTQ